LAERGFHQFRPEVVLRFRHMAGSEFQVRGGPNGRFLESRICQ
jgi:hypothetical protein